MNSPDASPTPAAMTPGPMMRQVDAGGAGNGRTSGRGRYRAGNRQAAEDDTSSCCLVIAVIPSREKGLAQDRTRENRHTAYCIRGIDRRLLVTPEPDQPGRRRVTRSAWYSRNRATSSGSSSGSGKTIN